MNAYECTIWKSTSDPLQLGLTGGCELPKVGSGNGIMSLCENKAKSQALKIL